MIFNFLRQFLKDDEFEKNKLELAETKLVLKEYKDFLQDQKENSKEEKEKVEPDFLVMLWAALGLSLSLAVQAANELPKSEKPVDLSTLTFDQGVWLVFTVISIIFLFLNGWFAFELTFEYARSKSHSGYKMFAYTLFAGVALIFIGVILLAIF